MSLVTACGTLHFRDLLGLLAGGKTRPEGWKAPVAQPKF
jgi:hypothetical protein